MSDLETIFNFGKCMPPSVEKYFYL